MASGHFGANVGEGLRDAPRNGMIEMGTSRPPLRRHTAEGEPTKPRKQHMALKNSTDRSALERLLLSRLPRKEISTLVQSYTQPYRELMSYYRCAMMEVETKFNVLK